MKHLNGVDTMKTTDPIPAMKRKDGSKIPKKDVEKITSSVEQNTPNQVISNQGASNQVVTNQVVMNQVVTNQGAPNQVVPNQVVPNQGAPNQGATNQVAPNQVAPNQVIPNVQKSTEHLEQCASNVPKNTVQQSTLNVEQGTLNVEQSTMNKTVSTSHSSLMKIIVWLLSRICDLNRSRNDEPCIFSSSSMIGINLEEYMSVVCSKCMEPNHSNYDPHLVVSLMYIDRFVTYRPEVAITIRNVHRLWITAFMLAVKFLDDDHYVNQRFASVGRISLKEMNHFESTFLFCVGFDLHLRDYNEYIRRLETQAMSHVSFHLQ